MKKTILVNGVNGFIGLALCKKLLSLNKFNFIFSSNKVPNEELLTLINNNINVKFVKSDLLDLESVSEIVIRSDHVVHLAGIVGNNKSDINIKDTFDVNVLGTLNIFKVATDLNKEITYLSLPNLNDFSTYALSKSCADRFAQMYLDYRGLNISILRLFNCYGPEQDLLSGKLIINLINKSINNKEIEIFGEGKQKFNFIYIDDAISCITKSILNHKKGIFYIGSKDEISINDITDKIISLTNSNSKIIFKNKRIGEKEDDQIMKSEFNKIELDRYTNVDVAISNIIKSFKND